MREIDRLAPGLRALVHEFGAKPIFAMLDDGWKDAGKIRAALAEGERRREAVKIDA